MLSSLHHLSIYHSNPLVPKETLNADLYIKGKFTCVLKQAPCYEGLRGEWKFSYMHSWSWNWIWPVVGFMTPVPFHLRNGPQHSLHKTMGQPGSKIASAVRNETQVLQLFSLVIALTELSHFLPSLFYFTLHCIAFHGSNASQNDHRIGNMSYRYKNSKKHLQYHWSPHASELENTQWLHTRLLKDTWVVF
jgi:hypothetical protein